MSFPRYPEYKDSGVEWLGQVPVHWNVGSSRWLTQRYSGGTPDKTKPEYWQDGTVPWLNSGAVNDRLITEPSTYITDEAFAKSSAKWIPKGALVMALAGQGKTKGMVAQLDIPSTCNQSMAAIIPGAAIEGRFLFWWLDANYQNIRNMAGGDLRDGLNLELLGNIQCPLPSHDEQSKIAIFLDRETTKIDALVAEQRRLMELLKEKRQAVISHAVTKGLIPDAPMKPSGIEWLGDVPAHWRVGKCGFYLSILSGFAFPSAGFSENDSDTKLLRGINVGVTRLKWNETVYWKREPDDGLGIYEMHEGDLVIGMDRPLISEGMRVAKVKESDLPCLLLQRVASLQTGQQLNADYLLGLLSSEMFVAHFSPETTGVSVPHISPEQINNFVIPVPPVCEQMSIVEFVDCESAKFDTLTAEAQRAIDLLQERRTALISAAVTGQIDVRHT